MPRKDRIDALGAVALVGFSAAMGLNQALIKLVNEGMAPIFQAGMRSAVAFPVVMLFAFLMARRLSLKDGSFWPGIFTGLLFSAEFMLLFKSVEFSSVARISILFYTMPMWVALGAHFLIPGERLTQWRVLGLLLAVAGVVLALSDQEIAAREDAWIGDVMALIGAVFWAGIALTARTTKMSNASPEMQLIYQLAVSAPIMIGVAIWTGDTYREMTYELFGIFLFQSLIVVGVGFLTWFWVLSIYPASNMASFSFLAPIFGVLAAWRILGEDVSILIIGALVLVAIGIVLVNRKPAPK